MSVTRYFSSLFNVSIKVWLISLSQEITLGIIAGNPFNSNIFETKDGKFVLLSAVYVDLVYQWIAFLGCSIAVEDIRYAVKKWNAKGD